MNLPVSAFPDSAKNIAESRNPEFCKNPVDEEHNCQVSNDEIVLDNNVQVQIIRHNSSFLRGLMIHGRISIVKSISYIYRYGNFKGK